MTRFTALILIFPLLALLAMAKPLDYTNPKSQVEYISSNLDDGKIKPNIVPITRPPLISQTAPPTPFNSKSFVYNPNSKTWTRINPGEPLPQAQDDDTPLIWNQSNDKWLTNGP
ncbi:uncharacterized protein Dwil_GK27630 [Drosophila willistoni]|uniref:Uncharacterized protein n=1 Tax=Drosophila willistoni TaxID=7260 RepID=A0A0Q9X0I3_DROWI|nr:uncharacterized protein LOC26529632 [Drosophila willistoni]KRF98968.1 uncharacterized protein Dwil_GK27630 [Drosophila willistoni]